MLSDALDVPSGAVQVRARQRVRGGGARRGGRRRSFRWTTAGLTREQRLRRRRPFLHRDGADEFRRELHGLRMRGRQPARRRYGRGGVRAGEGAVVRVQERVVLEAVLAQREAHPGRKRRQRGRRRRRRAGSGNRKRRLRNGTATAAAVALRRGRASYGRGQQSPGLERLSRRLGAEEHATARRGRRQRLHVLEASIRVHVVRFGTVMVVDHRRVEKRRRRGRTGERRGDRTSGRGRRAVARDAGPTGRQTRGTSGGGPRGSTELYIRRGNLAGQRAHIQGRAPRVLHKGIRRHERRGSTEQLARQRPAEFVPGQHHLGRVVRIVPVTVRVVDVLV